MKLNPPEYSDYIQLSPEAKEIFLPLIMCNSTKWHYFLESQKEYYEAINKRYRYLVTFTTKEDRREGADIFLESQAQREALQLVRFAYTTEHADSNLHYHVFMVSKRPLQKSDFKHWTNTRGYVDFKPVTESTEGNVLSYIAKETPPKELVF